MSTDPAQTTPYPDIVSRLRLGRDCEGGCRVRDARSGCICAEAADVIERLRAQFIFDTIEMGYSEDEAREILAEVEIGVEASGA